VVATGNDAVDGDRARPNDRSIGPERQDEGLGRCVDDDESSAVFEFDFVFLLIGRQERTVHQDAVGDEVQAPVAGTLKCSRHVWAGLGLFIHSRHYRVQHLPEGAKQGVTSATGGKASGGDATAQARSSDVLGF
jgi:hypothetical protein